MYAIAVNTITYSPSPCLSPEVVLGRAFARCWHERSPANDRQLREAIACLVDRLRADRRPPESSVVAFKDALRRFGGVHEHPSLAAEHHVDGDEYAAAYAEAFTIFVDAYFAQSPSR